MFDESIDTTRGRVTTNHQRITRWVEKHDGRPAMLDPTDHSVKYPRIDFPGTSDCDELTTVSWREWLNEFEAQELAFVYRERADDAKEFYKLVDRTTAAEHT